MRPRAPGMTNLDEVILEFMDSLGEPQGHSVLLSANVVQDNIEVRELADYSESTYYRRLQKLADKGFVKRVEDQGARYYITEKGRKYVAGELDPSEFEDLSDGD